MSRLKADLLLFLISIIWGAAFVAQKIGNQSIGPYLFVGIRFSISTLALAPFVVWETKRHKVPLTRADFRLAVLVGVLLFIGNSTQQVSLVTTTATNSGFLTALYIALVPFAAWLLQRTPVRPIVLLACAISITGAWLLAGFGVAKKWMPGDVLALAADIVWAFQIVLLSTFIRRTHRPFFLCFVECAITALLGLIVSALLREPVIGANIRAAMPVLLYAALMSGCVAYTIQIIAQRHTPPAEAALIMSLESVFAALSGAVLLGERLTLLAAIGCAMILLGVVIVEIGPLQRRGRNVA